MPYIGNTIRAADDYRLIDDISSSFNGSTTSFALQVAGSAPVPFPKSPQQVLISVNGVIQEPDPSGSSGFNLVGTNIVFSSAPTNGHAFFGIIYATADYLNAGGNFPAGSLGAPSITFIGDENTGLYRKGGGSIGFVADATEIANTDSNGLTISSGNLILPADIIHSGDTDTKIRFPAADTFSVETGGAERLSLGATTVFNETGADVDFRIEGDSEANLFYVDAGNDRIGVGTSTPQKPFNILASGTELIRLSQAVDGSTQQEFGIGWASDNNHTHPSAKITTKEFDASDSRVDLLFYTRGSNADSAPSERMRIDSSGRLLLGTTSPITTDSNAHAKLVAVSSAGPNIQLGNNSTDIDNNDRLGTINYSGNHGGTFRELASLRSAADGDHTGSSCPSRLELYTTSSGATGPTERMRIDSSGNVAIGATSVPTGFKLAVNGDLTLGEASGSDNSFIDQKQNGALEIINSGRDDNDGSIRINRSNTIAGGTTRFRDTLIYNGKGTQLLFVDGSANRIGIGSAATSPGFMLDVQHATDNSLRLGNTNNSSHGSHFAALVLGATYYNKAYMAAHSWEFYVNGSSLVKRFEMQSGGDFKLNDGNVVIGASGHGIDFSDTSDGSGSMTSELLDDYEEGTFTARLGGTSNSSTYYISGTGTYIKIGRKVTVSLRFNSQDLDNNASGDAKIFNMPFTAGLQPTNGVVAVTGDVQYFNVPFSTDHISNWYISDNSTAWVGLVSRSNTSWTSFPVSDFHAANVYINFSGTYFTAS